MNTIRKLISSMALVAMTTSAATAGRYDSGATYAKVVDVQPIYETYEVPETRRVCRDETYREPQRRSNAGGAVLGSIIGGLIGSQVGSGKGRKAATAAGVLTGAAIGSQSKSHNNRANRSSRHCYNKTVYHEEQRVAAYDVAYQYDGQIRHATMQNHPGKRVKVQVNVQLAEY